MRTTIETVRLVVATGVVLLVLIVAGFLSYAHRRSHQLLSSLPSRLGADIQKETNGFTYSQSVKGRTVFTIHAAKATQHKDGRTGLEDVGIVLYGEKDGRADRIRGKDFEYDQRNGVIRAVGEVQMELQAPASGMASAQARFAGGGGAEMDGSDTQPVHVSTSNLVYREADGVATTEAPMRFEYRGMTGRARGVRYEARSGRTTLEHEVQVAGLRDGRPAVLTAAHAEFERAQQVLRLETAKYLLLGRPESGRATSESMSAGTLLVHLAEGGGVKSAEGSDGVELRSVGNVMQAPRGTLRVNGEGRPESARLTGGVHFAEADENSSEANGLQGGAAEGEASFDANGELAELRLRDRVQAQSVAGEGDHTGETRQLSGQRMAIEFAGGEGHRRWAERAVLTGEASLTSASSPNPADREALKKESVRADWMEARWALTSGRAELRRVTGHGHTELRRLQDGTEETSRGTELLADFEPPVPNGRGDAVQRSAEARTVIKTVVQRGDVTLERSSQARAPRTTAQEVQAKASEAIYDAASGRTLLRGGVTMFDGGSTLRAEQVTMMDVTGDAQATGTVQATLRQELNGVAPGAPVGPAEGKQETEPMHAVGERALLQHESGTTTFYGKLGGGRARLWQAGSQIEAPMIAYNRKDGVLEAGGTGGVLTVLARPAAEEVPPGKSTTRGGGAKALPGVLRVSSGELRYAEATRQATFREGVLLQSADGTIRSRDAVVTLERGAAVKGERGAEFGSAPERIVATGGVEIRQPGRIATGERAVYESAEGEFLLTGVMGAPPRVTDEATGTVTGAALRFRTVDNSVTVEGRMENAAAGDGRVHSRARIKR